MLNFFKQKPPREIKAVGFEPGFSTFIEFRSNTVNNVKPPSREVLLEAVRVFFDHKLRLKKPVNKTQAFVARLVIEHLQADRPGRTDAPQSPNELERKAWLAQPMLNREDLQKVLRALAIHNRYGKSKDVADLAVFAYEELKALQMSLPSWNGTDKRKRKLSEIHSEDLPRLFTILTHHDQTKLAAEMLSNFEDVVKDPANPRSRDEEGTRNKLFELHLKVLRGYGREGDHSLLREYAKMLCNAGFPYTSEFAMSMTNAFASMGEDGEEELREWFEKSLVHEDPSRDRQLARLQSPKVYMDLVTFSSKTGRQPDWLKTALQELCDMNPPKRWWDVIIKWAVCQGKDIGHIRNMIGVMAQVNPEDESVRADILTINGMLRVAIAHKAYFLAERINSLASELGLRPNAETHISLLKARIAGQDSIGAASAFQDLIHTGSITPASEANEVVNSYLRYLCSTTDSRTVIDTLSRAEAQQGELEPETVVEVCLKFLRDDRTMEVVDTLGLHLNHFSMDERRVVREELLRYCLDMSISTARAWDVYSLLRQFLPETSREERTNLMKAFFYRKRPDMACHIFGHMRSHADDKIRPDAETYIICLENLGSYPDSESLTMIHNMFKMDALIQPSTKLYNAFIIAYTGCNEPRKAYEFWRQVANSKDGPTYKSLELAFRACQKLPYGYDRAKVIWDKMHSMEVDIPAPVYDAYILMLAGQAQLDNMKAMLLARHTDYAEEPAQILLTRIFNALPYPDLQQAYKEWAALEFPDKWQKIQKLRMTKTIEGTDRISSPPERMKAE
ncbi:hypothetical protein N0V93_000053 [Gnomoniopsis smithogilvyi]|uniref:Complex I intermediate-associated protein 84 n=1 Tax=Gnomoniopsis smithogilvyi TaxID=1191159 RepID=A0A9W9D114_9PEZI|nr:hypothetical protein N0V93_000053 [Gnomoniopsis smithogilvyi]